MFIDTEPHQTAGIISLEKPVDPDPCNKYVISQDSTMTPAIHNLVVNVGDGGNLCILDASLTSITDGYNFVCTGPDSAMTNAPILGFVMSVPHTIKVSSSDIVYATGITTHLCVAHSVRREKLAMALIRSVINTGFANKIYTGYHYTSQSRTSSSIPVKAWYRVLDVRQAFTSGYTIVVPKVEGVAASVQVVEAMYKCSITLPHRSTIADDFTLLQRRSISIDMTSEPQWDRLSNGPVKWVSILDPQGNLLAVAGYRKYTIHRHRNNTMINAAQLVYIETAPDIPDPQSAMTSVFGIIKGDGYSVVHGIQVGPLNDCADDLRLIRTDVMYLDFYNLGIQKGLSSGQVSILYL